MRGLRWLNGLLLVASWLLAALGTYVSLLTGLVPWLAAGVLLTWTVLSWLVLRLSFTDTPNRLRLALPLLFLVMSLVCFRYSFQLLRSRYQEENGFPRRYYSTESTTE